MRIIHGDLHQWNVRNARGVLSPIDFEDLMLGWPMQDIATTLYYFDAENISALRDAFQTGYTRQARGPKNTRVRLIRSSPRADLAWRISFSTIPTPRGRIKRASSSNAWKNVCAD